MQAIIRTVYPIFTDNLDLICYSEHEWQQEFKDLKNMGLDTIRVLRIEGEKAENAAFDLDEILRDKGRIGRKAFKLMETEYSVSITILKHYRNI